MKAICTDDTTEEHKNYKGKPVKEKIKGLTKDKEYEVKQSKEYEDYYEVMSDLGSIETYKKYRFKIVEGKKMEKGFKVRCINNLEGQQHLTIGKEYIADEGFEEGYYKIENDKGTKWNYPIELFEKVEDVFEVKCIINGQMEQLALTIGKIYYAIDSPTVKGAYQIRIDDLGRKNMNFSKDWFEKVEDVLMVECIDNKGKEHSLTIGKKYKIENETSTVYWVINDNKEKWNYSKDRFKPVEPQKECNKKTYSAVELLDFPVSTKFKNDRTVFEIVEFEEGNKGIVIAETKGEMIFSTNLLKVKFTKVEEPKQVTTSEAFKALEEGKEIESFKGYRYKKENNKIKCTLEVFINKYIDFEELENNWIILE